MRSPRTRVSAALLSCTLLSGLALAASPGTAPAAPPAPSEPAVTTVLTPVATKRYLSAPPSAGTARPTPPEAPADGSGPVPSPTKGTLVGRVLTPNGRPYAGGLVQAIGFRDLGRGIDVEKEQPVVTRTDAQGRFRMPQPAERYLVRVCDARAANRQCGDDRDPDRYATTYVGPDAVSDSWVTQTRMFAPVQPTRRLATFRMKPYAVLSGTVHGVDPGSFVHLIRGNRTEAHRVRVDRNGRYTARVVPGRYRVEVDRIEGLSTPSTVPGFRSRWLELTAARPTRLSIRTAPAAAVAGLLTVAGEPVVDRVVGITDDHGRWAAGAVTDERGRFAVDSLRPGRYRVQTLNFSSDEVPVSRWVDLSVGTTVRADLETTAGTAVGFALQDGDRTAEVAVEVRNAAGQLTRAFRLEAGQRYRVPGFAAGSYQIVWRRYHDPSTGEPEDVLPWAQRTVTVTGDGTVDLGRVALDRPTLTLSGTLPAGAQVKFATYPADEVYRSAYVDGPAATDVTLPLTAVADASGHYLSHGWVPGRYAVTVSTARRERGDGPSSTGGNVAVGHETLVHGEHDQTAGFTTREGGILTARLRYAGTSRPLIGPLGYEVRDRGPGSTLFPTVSGPQTFGGGVRVDRLQAGRVTGRLLDYERLGLEADRNAVLVPDSLLDSAPFAETRTPYWLSAPPRVARVAAGRTTRLGDVAVRIRR